MAPNHGGDPLGSILGPMGSHLVKEMGQNRKKLPCRKIRIFDFPAVIHFSQKMDVTIITPNHSGDPLGSMLGPMGSHLVQKEVKTVKNYHAKKLAFLTTVIDFSKKMEVTVIAPNHSGDPKGPSCGQWGPIGSKKWI